MRPGTSLEWDQGTFLVHPTWDRDQGTPLLVTAGGHHWRPVQTCSIDLTVHPLPYRPTWWPLKSYGQGKRAERILLERFLVKGSFTSSQNKKTFFHVCHFYRSQRSWGKVMFLHVSVILFTRGGCLPLYILGYSPPEQTPPRSSACWEIRATSLRYASYWNIYLFYFAFTRCEWALIILFNIKWKQFHLEN